MGVRRKKDAVSALSECIVAAMQEKKGNRIAVINLTTIKNAICDQFIICHGTSRTQVESIADGIRRKVKTDLGISASHSEGHENAQWILIDYFDVVVHVFIEEARNYYRLEELWADADALYI